MNRDSSTQKKFHLQNSEDRFVGARLGNFAAFDGFENADVNNFLALVVGTTENSVVRARERFAREIFWSVDRRRGRLRSTTGSAIRFEGRAGSVERRHSVVHR